MAGANTEMVAAILVAAGLTTGCGPPLFECADEVLSRMPSSDGRYVAVAYERNCGATTGYARHVALMRSADKSYGEAIAVFGGQPEIELSWSGSSLAVRTTASDGNVYRQKARWGDVTVNYVHVPPDQPAEGV